MSLARALVSLLMTLPLLLGCGAEPETAASQRPIRWVATTSVQDTGLLESLVEELQRRTGSRIEAVAVGSGQAFELARRGDADLLMTHAPALEEEFLATGLATRHRILMTNDFVIVGPPDDPAGIRGSDDAVEALRRIAASGSSFVSRADRSGTHLCEKQLRDEHGIEFASEQLIETGLGQASSLRVAAERGAYTLTDRATFTVHARTLDLESLAAGDVRLANRYRLFEIAPEHRPAGNDPRIAQLFETMTDPTTAEFIEAYGVDDYGRSLFRSEESYLPSSDDPPRAGPPASQSPDR